MAQQFSSSSEHIDVAYVAQLARLHLTDDEKVSFQAQLDQVLTYVEQLREADVEGIEPTSHAVRLINVLREDEPGASLEREGIQANAPDWQDGQIRVPKIIE